MYATKTADSAQQMRSALAKRAQIDGGKDRATLEKTRRMLEGHEGVCALTTLPNAEALDAFQMPRGLHVMADGQLCRLKPDWLERKPIQAVAVVQVTGAADEARLSPNFYRDEGRRASIRAALAEAAAGAPEGSRFADAVEAAAAADSADYDAQQHWEPHVGAASAGERAFVGLYVDQQQVARQRRRRAADAGTGDGQGGATGLYLVAACGAPALEGRSRRHWRKRVAESDGSVLLGAGDFLGDERLVAGAAAAQARRLLQRAAESLELDVPSREDRTSFVYKQMRAEHTAPRTAVPDHQQVFNMAAQIGAVPGSGGSHPLVALDNASATLHAGHPFNTGGHAVMLYGVREGVTLAPLAGERGRALLVPQGPRRLQTRAQRRSYAAKHPESVDAQALAAYAAPEDTEARAQLAERFCDQAHAEVDAPFEAALRAVEERFGEGRTVRNLEPLCVQLALS
jgi:hypothetical protein